jgi:hypothetical protein
VPGSITFTAHFDIQTACAQYTLIHSIIPLIQCLSTQHLRRLFPRPKVLFFYQKEASPMKVADLTTGSKGPPKLPVYQSLWHLLILCLLSTSSSIRTPENSKEDPNDPEPEDKRTYSSD